MARFTLGDGWYKWEYKSAMEDPKFVAAGSNPTSYSDSGTGLCNSPHGIGGVSNS